MQNPPVFVVLTHRCRLLIVDIEALGDCLWYVVCTLIQLATTCIAGARLTRGIRIEVVGPLAVAADPTRSKAAYQRLSGHSDIEHGSYRTAEIADHRR